MELLNVRQVAEFLHLNEKKVYSLIASEGLPATKVTGKWLFPKDLVEQWLKGSVSMPRGGPAAESGILMVVGSDDPLLEELLGRLNRSFGDTVTYFGSTGSAGGLLAVARGQGHLAASHLWDAETDTYNRRQVAQVLADQEVVLVNFAYREQGFIVARGNPKSFRGFEDLARSDISLVNRQKGSGTRQLLDAHLAKSGIPADKIRGYDRELDGHFAVGLSVLKGEADVGMAVRCAATAFSLDFIPVKEERYDLVVPHETLSAKPLQRLLEMIAAEESRKTAERLGGYSMRDTGKLFAAV